MLRTRTAALAATLILTLSGATAASAHPVHDAAASTSVSARAAQHATGDFTAEVDFTTLRATDVLGHACRLTVNGVLHFTGSLDGEARGTTTAVVHAPCSEVTTAPPGAYFDVFRFAGTFTGTVHGVPTTGDLRYAGITWPGGAIRALVRLTGERATAVLRADATVAVGGSYTGVARASGR
ncbi:hypothetical protein PU560_03350 [Georgenia sp. 10Sc9-8]|uniref:Uncharacterized protein n=1 Tax=Georgenia halotolerans TaxID=3028317 RepID=A0ABT5TTX4_9MICO|nr:hypothetical protein [Georgenia halotolerans]